MAGVGSSTRRVRAGQLQSASGGRQVEVFDSLEGRRRLGREDGGTKNTMTRWTGLAGYLLQRQERWRRQHSNCMYRTSSERAEARTANHGARE